MSENRNDAAFPVMHGNFYTAGLTKREWFAGMALQGILAGTPLAELDSKGMWGAIARDSITAADAILSQLENKEP